MARSPKGPTLEDVARVAGVSRATVSRVVNGGHLVSPSAAASVQRAIDQLGYAPNQAARMLVTRRSGLVAILVPESDRRVFSDPFFAEVHHGVVEAFVGHPAHVVLATSKPGEPAEAMRDYLTSGRVDGALVASHHGSALAEALRGIPQPVLFIGDPGADGFSYVDVRQEVAAGAAVRHLLDRGATRLGTITGPLDMTAGHRRYVGFETGLTAAGLQPAAVAHGTFTIDSGEEAAHRILEVAPDVDGLFVASDLMAAGALRALADAGRRVPEDVRVVSFDNSEVALQTRPRLTTMTNPAYELAGRACELLIDALEHGAPAQPVAVELDSELVVRESA